MSVVKDILDVFRPKRWYRNFTMVLGSVIALRILHIPIETFFTGQALPTFLLALVSVCLVASGNYGINEVLDSESDKHHPEKKNRAIPSGRINARFVIIISIILYLVGIVLVSMTGNLALVISVALLLLSGIVYNVPPIRLKDRAYIDFTSEALNNPIRLMIGWYAITDASNIVPVSFVLGYWFFGVFLMAAKRFGEIRVINNKAKAKKYRLSLQHYTEERLIMAMIAGVTAFSFMLGAISFKYSVDIVIVLPVVVVWVVWFFKLAFEKNSIVISPERIFEKKYFVALTLILVVIFLALFYSGNQILGWVK